MDPVFPHHIFQRLQGNPAELIRVGKTAFWDHLHATSTCQLTDNNLSNVAYFEPPSSEE